MHQQVLKVLHFLSSPLGRPAISFVLVGSRDSADSGLLLNIFEVVRVCQEPIVQVDFFSELYLRLCVHNCSLGV